MPLQPKQVKQPFLKQGLDFIGVINLPSSLGCKWVLTTTDYFTKWIEVVALREANEIVVLNFYEELVTRFGVPDSIISDNALASIGSRISNWAVKNGTYLNTSSNYYLQVNGQDKSTNKNLIRIIKKTMEGNQRSWHTKLRIALQADRITPKRSTGVSPYTLVYGKEDRLPISVELPSLDLANQFDMTEEELMTTRLAQLSELEEVRDEAMKKLEVHQEQMKRSFDKRASSRVFKERDVVLKWDEFKSRPGKHKKFDAFWSGSYIISECKQHNVFQLSRLDGVVETIPVNGIHLKHFF